MVIGMDAISRIHLELAADQSVDPSVWNDWQAALRDLERESLFRPVSAEGTGPYALTLSIEENRLVVRIRDARGRELRALVLSLRPYTAIIRDYFLLIHSHHQAIAEGMHARIEAIDMGRRGLHNEGAALLASRLADKVEMDQDTARRLFTLICVLHSGKAVRWY